MLGDDLEYTDDRVQQRQAAPALVKKNITLKLKSANVTSSSSSLSTAATTTTVSQIATPSPSTSQTNPGTNPGLVNTCKNPPQQQTINAELKQPAVVESQKEASKRSSFVSNLNWNMNVREIELNFFVLLKKKKCWNYLNEKSLKKKRSIILNRSVSFLRKKERNE